MSRETSPLPAVENARAAPDGADAGAPARYAVAGNPVSHSKSPDIHAAFALQTGQRMVYGRELLPLDGFAEGARRFFAEGGRGLNVTVPFKLDAHALAARLEPRARAAGAVNTLSLINGELVGDNTDGIGLVRDITQRLGVPLDGRNILLLGAGGAARGVIGPLLECRPALLQIANRTPAKAGELVRLFAVDAGHFGVRLEASPFDAVAHGGGVPFDLIINGTAGSLQGEVPPLPPSGRWTPDALAYDMMYGAEPTVFMRAAAALGARAEDGLGMLVGQAAESFAIWRGVHPDTAPVLAMLRAALRGAAHG